MTGCKVEIVRADLTAQSEIASLARRIGADASIKRLVDNAGMALDGTIVDEEPATIA